MRNPAGGPDSAAWVDFRRRVKSALPLQDIIQRISGAKFESAGQGFKACCPFHAEKTPSFFVNAESNTYRCFGAGCGAKGDVFSFLGEWYGMSFGQALKHAGELAGIDLPSLVEKKASNEKLNPPGDAWRVCCRSQPSLIRTKPKPERSLIADVRLHPFPPNADLPKPGRPLQIIDPVKKRNYSVSPRMVHAYRQPGGEARLLVLRVEKRGGGKFFLQVGDPSPGSDVRTVWKLIRFPAGSLRPLYGLEDLPAWERHGSGKILLVEGEKTRDAASRLLPLENTGILSLSNFGGGSCGSYAEWKPAVEAARRLSASGTAIEIKIWPDADPPIRRADGSTCDRQDRFARSLASSFLDSADKSGGLKGEVRIARVAPPGELPPGWDLADAEAQKWTTSRILDALENCESVISPDASAAARIAEHGPAIQMNRPFGPSGPVPTAANECPEFEI